MKKLLGRKAYTLVELVLAIAITAIIASLSSTLIGYAVQMRKMSDAQTAMYMTSLRIHKAISSELAASGEVILYTKTPTSYTQVPATERVLYVNGGKLYYSNKSSSKTALLPMTNGFDSYNGVEIESISYKAVMLVDYINTDTSEPSNVFRCVQVTTVVKKGDWSYTHSTTVRFDEMILDSSQVKISTSETSFDKANTKLPSVSDTTVYPIIRYAIN